MRRDHLQGLHTMAQEWLWEGHCLPALTWGTWPCLPRSLTHLALRWPRVSRVLHQSHIHMAESGAQAITTGSGWGPPAPAPHACTVTLSLAGSQC